jgi:hypothetical protein
MRFRHLNSGKLLSVQQVQAAKK